MTKLEIKRENGKSYVEYKEKKLSVEITTKGVNTEMDIFDMSPAARGGTASIEVKAKVGDFSCTTIIDDEGRPVSYDLFAEDRENGRFEVIFKIYERAGAASISMGIV